MPIVCIYCEHPKTIVRHTKDNRRFRKCIKCGKVWTTLEIPELEYKMLCEAKAILKESRRVRDARLDY